MKKVKPYEPEGLRKELYEALEEVEKALFKLAEVYEKLTWETHDLMEGREYPFGRCLAHTARDVADWYKFIKENLEESAREQN